jgi:hypothetical protein
MLRQVIRDHHGLEPIPLRQGKTDGVYEMGTQTEDHPDSIAAETKIALTSFTIRQNTGKSSLINIRLKGMLNL